MHGHRISFDLICELGRTDVKKGEKVESVLWNRIQPHPVFSSSITDLREGGAFPNIRCKIEA